jgi:hypothetical protein
MRRTMTLAVTNMKRVAATTAVRVPSIFKEPSRPTAIAKSAARAVTRSPDTVRTACARVRRVP